MNLIICLGNPGKEYEKNRHNIGFRMADAIIQEFGFESKGYQNKSHVYDGLIHQKKIFLIKPQTYMNLSGEAVAEIIHFYKIPLENIIVIYDDIDLPFGKIKLKPKGSAGTHNGMKSIVSKLGSEEFPRLRLGIGPAPEKWDLSDFVLSNFNKEEENQLIEIQNTVIDLIKTYYEKDITFVMSLYN